jgi:hypothetical protein
MKPLMLLSSIFILVFAGINCGIAQSNPAHTTGLYLTPDDFLQHKLTYQIDCNNGKDKLKLNDLFGSSKGYVDYDGQKKEFDKNRVYGYRSCENKNYRFYNHSIYQIIDTAGFYIYYQYRSEEQTKGKGLIKKDEYFFSRKGDGAIRLLTIDNLKNAFPENHQFHFSLDAEYKSDNELMAYDYFLNTYKIKYLYSQSLK